MYNLFHLEAETKAERDEWQNH